VGLHLYFLMRTFRPAVDKFSFASAGISDPIAAKRVGKKIIAARSSIPHSLLVAFQARSGRQMDIKRRGKGLG